MTPFGKPSPEILFTRIAGAAPVDDGNGRTRHALRG